MTRPKPLRFAPGPPLTRRSRRLDEGRPGELAADDRPGNLLDVQTGVPGLCPIARSTAPGVLLEAVSALRPRSAAPAAGPLVQGMRWHLCAYQAQASLLLTRLCQ